MKLRLRLSLFCALAACAAPVERDTLARSGNHPRRPATALPDDWRSASTFGFEALVAELRAAGPTTYDDAGYSALAAALEGADQTAVRAAVLLAYATGERAENLLLAALEARRPAPARERDAADVVAAAALSGRGLERGFPARLAALAAGPAPHPDLEVRVEAASSALAGGVDAPVPFLLRVLRARTPEERSDPPDWEPTRHLAWSKSRAAEALSARAGVPCAFRADGSWEHQVSEARRLEQLLGDGPR